MLLKSFFGTNISLRMPVLIVCLMFFASFGVQAEDAFPKLSQEFLDNIKGADGTWPDDPAVPKNMPPLPVTDDSGLNPDAFLTTHYTTTIGKPKIANPPPPLNGLVNSDNPLTIDVFWSMRSPYSYLSMHRLLYLHSNYNVNLTIRILMPIAVRSTKGGSGSAGGMFGITYKVPDLMWDTVRQGKYLGVPFRYAVPDPVWQDLHPPFSEGYQYVHPPKKQPYIHWITRLGNYAEMNGKSVEYIHQISQIIWDGSVEHWPAHVKERFNRIEGLDYDKAIQFIRDHPEKVDQVWMDNQDAMAATGHGGVPLMVFQNEPFFGGDRFDQFVWRLRQSGLTRRVEPIEPIVVKPLRWPGGE